MKIIRNKWDNTISQLYLETAKVNFNIELRGYITVFEGWSSSGKTFFMKSLQNFCVNNPSIMKQYNISNILIFDYTDLKNNILKRIKAEKNSLIIIDNGDMLLSIKSPLVKYLSYDRYNQYIIMSRGGVSLPITPNHYCNLIQEKNIILTKFNYNIEGWK